jgi:hypothetical protein
VFSHAEGEASRKTEGPKGKVLVVNICRVCLRSHLLSWELRIKAGAYLDSVERQPRGYGRIVVHRCEDAKPANPLAATGGPIA